MNETLYKFRVRLTVPETRRTGLDAWIQEEFRQSEAWLIEVENGWQTCFACTLADTDKWATRLTSDGGIPLPPEFALMNADQRIEFMRAASPTLEALTGVRVEVCRNDRIPWEFPHD